LFDLAAAIGIRDKQHFLVSILKNTSLENEPVYPLEIKDFLPFRRILEKCAHVKCSAPVEIAGRIVAVPQNG
jgi:hypothetical protein